MSDIPQNDLNQDRLIDSLKYLYYFYRYIFAKKSKDVLVSVLINFGIGLLPLALVYFFEISELSDERQRQFFGDGNVVIFGFGVLASFLSVSVSSLRDTKTKLEQNNFVNDKTLLLIFQLIFYFLSYKVFEKAQTNFDRSWDFIYQIGALSLLFLIVACLTVLFLQFESRYDYSVIHPYMEEVEANKKARKAKKKNKSGEIEL
jgi:sulfite exporter TauE/SafE